MTDVPQPMLALIAEALPTGPRWSYEVKWDGYRCLAVKTGQRVTLRSRNGADLTRTYPVVAEAVKGAHARSCVLDGEIVALDRHGHPSFQALQHRRAPATIVYYAFDLLERDGRPLAHEPLAARRAALRNVVVGTDVLLSEPLPGTPSAIERELRRLGIEGVIAKRVDSLYEAGRRSGAWTKVKFQRSQEFVVGGFSPEGDRVNALVVGCYEGSRLEAAGRVRAGLTPLVRRALYADLLKLRRKTCPFVNLPNSTGKSHWGEGITAADMHKFVWVRPLMVVQVAFTEWTEDGSLRHARFVGVREDVAAAQVTRER